MSENELKNAADKAGNAADKVGDELEIERVSFGAEDADTFGQEVNDAAGRAAVDPAGGSDAAEGAVSGAPDGAENISESLAEGADEGAEAFRETAGETVIADDMVDPSRLFRAGKGPEGQNGAGAAEETDGRSGKGSSKKRKGKKNVGKEILSWVLTFVIAFLVAIIINAYFFRISKVSGNSMLRTFTDGQTVFISRAPYIFSEPKYGDVVVFDHDQVHRNIFVEIQESLKYNIVTMTIKKENDSHKYWIKRVIGVPGDTIEIKTDGVYRNGVLLGEDYVNPDEVPDYSRYLGVWKVGEGQLFVMGDNRNHSSDSRVIGLITINSVLGKVLGQ